MLRSHHAGLIVLATWITHVTAVAETIRVPGDHETIQEAIDASRDGDTILVGAGEYVTTAPIYFRGKSITLRAEQGPEQTVIRMAETPADPEFGSVVVFFASDVETTVLEGFTITGGQGVRWGNEQNEQRGGGGVYCEFEARPRIVDCRITGNSSQRGGGILGVFGASPTLVRCVLSGNTAELTGGGGTFLGGSPTLMECTVSENVASSTDVGQGGGLFFLEGAPTMEDCVVSGNLAQAAPEAAAGAIGGGLLLAATSGEVVRTTITHNASVSTFGNAGGVAVMLGATPTLRDCDISANLGGIGGGLDCSGEAAPILESCRIVGNFATHEFGGGGLRCWQAAPIVRNCLIAGNIAYWGGAVQCFEASPEIVNSVVVGNFAQFGGGGVQFMTGSDGLIRSSTIVANATAADVGGGLNCSDSNPQIVDSIVWANTPASICGQVESCLTDEDPLFVEMGEFQFDRFQDIEIGGVPLQLPDFVVRLGDYRLHEGSPAIDGATSGDAPAADILGNRRCGQGADIGAYEYLLPGCVENPFQRGEIELNGRIDLTDGVAILLALFSGAGEPPCLKAADISDDGEVNITDALLLFQFLFQGGDAPAEPFVECGVDETPDDLTCETATCESDS